MISYFLKNLYATKPKEFIDKATNFFKKISKVKGLIYINNTYNTKIFLRFTSSCLWGEAFGDLKSGESGVIPCGEIALTHVKFHDIVPHPLPINGSITLSGYPIVHQYNLRSQSAANHQAELYQQLSTLKHGAIKAQVKQGVIVDLELLDNTAGDAFLALKKLFANNPYYRTIIEIGHGINTKQKLINGNCSMNESFGNKNLCIHYGFGHVRYSDYHIDILCPETKIERGPK